MAPTESTILTNYLTVAAKLPAILTLEQFASYFPKSQQSSPHVRSLYRHLQHQRNTTVDNVSQNIEREEKLSRAMRREAARARKEVAQDEPDAELEIERALFANAGQGVSRHNLRSIIPELDSAVQDLEAEVQRLEAEEEALQESIRQTVGGLSDLRYGRLSNQRLPDEVIQGLRTLQQQCDTKT